MTEPNQPDDEPVRQIKLEEKFTRLEAAFRIQKFADPPHPLALVLQVLSPLLTVAALVFTVVTTRNQSVRTERAIAISQQSMKVGQRAYVGIENGVVDWNGNTYKPKPELGTVVNVVMKFDIRNLGNTPATLVDYHVDITPPLDWERSFDYGHPYAGTVIAGHSSLSVNDLSVFSAPQPYMISERAAAVVIKGSLTYRDIFSDAYNIGWCWVAQSWDHYAIYAPDRCEPTVVLPPVPETPIPRNPGWVRPR